MKIETMAVCLIAGLSTLAPVVRADDDDQGQPFNFVYVNSNNPDGNAVIGYARDPVTGNINELRDSPFSTKGLGYMSTTALGPDDHDQELAVSPDRRFLYAVNQGSNTIAVFRVLPTGALIPVPGSPFPSGGVQPSSIGVDGNLVVVVNRGDQGPGGSGGTNPPVYQSFAVLPNGGLAQIPGSKLQLVPGSSPSQALIAPSGKLMFDSHLFETPFNNTGYPPFIPPFSSVLHSYTIGILGQITPAAVAPLPPAVPPFILGLRQHPDEQIVYGGLVVAGALATWTYDGAGSMTLSAITAGSPSNGICWIAMSPDHKYLFGAGAISDVIDVYSIANPASPVYVGTTALAGPKNPVDFAQTATLFDTTPFQHQTSADGKFLYVVNHDATLNDSAPFSNAMHILQIGSGGTLTEVAGSPLFFPPGEVPENAHPLGVLAF